MSIHNLSSSGILLDFDDFCDMTLVTKIIKIQQYSTIQQLRYKLMRCIHWACPLGTSAWGPPCTLLGTLTTIVVHSVIIYLASHPSRFISSCTRFSFFASFHVRFLFEFLNFYDFLTDKMLIEYLWSRILGIENIELVYIMRQGSMCRIITNVSMCDWNFHSSVFRCWDLIHVFSLWLSFCFLVVKWMVVYLFTRVVDRTLWLAVLIYWIFNRPKQQAKVARYCRTMLGDMLLTEPLDSHPVRVYITV